MVSLSEIAKSPSFFKLNATENLTHWATKPNRKSLIINGARQIGKSWAVRELGKTD